MKTIILSKDMVTAQQAAGHPIGGVIRGQKVILTKVECKYRWAKVDSLYLGDGYSKGCGELEGYYDSIAEAIERCSCFSEHLLMFENTKEMWTWVAED